MLLCLTGFEIRGLEQEAYKDGWLPFVTLDTDGCPFLEGHCTAGANVDLKFAYGVKIAPYFPRVISLTI